MWSTYTRRSLAVITLPGSPEDSPGAAGVRLPRSDVPS